MPILFHDLNDFFNLLSMSVTISAGCIVVYNSGQRYDVCVTSQASLNGVAQHTVIVVTDKSPTRVNFPP